MCFGSIKQSHFLAAVIQLYNGDVEVLTKSMDCIQKTAASILDGIQAQLAAAESKEVAA